MPVRRGSAPSFTAIYRGSTPYREVRQGTTLVWSGSPINSGDWIDWWVDELCDLVTDPGAVISDGIGNIIDGLGNGIGTVVGWVEGGANGLGTLVSNAGGGVIDAYCSMWGGTAPPNGLIGLINGIPIIGGVLSDLLDDFFTGTIDIDHLIGQIPVIGGIGQAIGLLPDAAGQLIDQPLNFVVDAAGNVVGTITCGAYTDIGGTISEGLCYLIGQAGQAVRILIPDGLMTLNTQTARSRNTVLAASDDGYVETQVAEAGGPGMITQVFRRYDNSGAGASGVGIDVRDSLASIVRRVGSTNTLITTASGGTGPGDTLRLDQLGNTHTLTRNGIVLGEPWVDDTNTAASGAANRSVGVIMQGAKELMGPRRFSPSLTYIRAA